MEDRKGSYKNNSLNTSESRMRRHEVTVELRKSKREDQMFKRRNINTEDITSPLKESNGQSPILMSIPEIVTYMNSGVPDKELTGMQIAREMLSREINPPIEKMIKRSVVPTCVKFLQNFDNPLIQLEAAWALTNIASGTSEQTRCVIENDAVPHLIPLLQSKNLNLAEQAVWALSNIAADGAAARDTVIKHKVIDCILKVCNEDKPLSFLRTIVWLMSNLCRNNNPSPPFDEIKRLLPVLSHLLSGSDTQVLGDACWALSYVTDGENQKIQAVVDSGAVPHLVASLGTDEPEIIVPALRSVGNIVTGTDQQTDTVIAAGGLPKLAALLSHPNSNIGDIAACIVSIITADEPEIIVPALRSVGNIVTGTDQQTDTVIAAGGLPKLAALLSHPNSNIVEIAACIVSTITAGNQKQIQAVIDADLFIQIRHVLEKGDFKSQKQAACVITNTIVSGASKQIVALIEKYQILKPFCDLLDASDPCTIKVVLTGLSNLFALVDRLDKLEYLCLMVERMKVLGKLQAFKQHEDEEIYKKAISIVLYWDK